MLREYRLTNFKAFGDTVTIPIRPLTLIFGANSSGKSSIFQSLLLLKQMVRDMGNLSTVLLPKGNLVDLGTYSDLVHRHDTDLDFEVGIRFEFTQNSAYAITDRWLYPAGPPYDYYDSFQMAVSAVLPKVTGLDIQYAYVKEKNVAAIRRENIYINNEDRPGLSCFPTQLSYPISFLQVHSESTFWRDWWNSVKKGLSKHSDLKRSSRLTNFINNRKYEDAIKLLSAYAYSRDWEELRKSCPSLRPESLKAAQDALAGKDELARIQVLDENINSLNLSVASDLFHAIPPIYPHFLDSMVHLGPLRTQPERYYTFIGDTPNYVGQSGERLPSLLFQKPELVDQINEDLERLKIKYQLKFRRLQYEEDASPSNMFSLRLVGKDTSVDASIRDVGFGIGQVLPIVAQSGLSEKKTLLIEQPEIHLHPAHQAELGDLFIRSAKERGNTLLLETHSENLILRVLRRIRETTEGELPSGLPPIRPEDVAVLYVQPGENGAQVIEIPVTEDGDFARPWPQGFFEESIKELV